LAVKAPKGVGESTRKKLLDLGVLDVSLRIDRTDDHIIIPVTKVVEGMEGLEVVEADLEERGLAETDYKKVVRLPENLVPLLPTSFDIVGDVGIVRLPEELVPHAIEVGRAMRCPDQVPVDAARLIGACNYNLFHRTTDTRFWVDDVE